MSGLLRALYGVPKATSIGGFQVQTSVYGIPIAIVYGMARVAGNLIHMPKLPVPAGQSKQQSKGAAGGTTYHAPLILGLTEGPILAIGYVWRDKDGKLTFVGNYNVDGWGLALGTSAPSPWSYLTTNYPAQALGYQSLAYVYNDSAPLPNDSLSSYSWEVLGFSPFDASSDPYSGGIKDASPAVVIPDLLTNARFGVGWNSAQIGPTTVFADYCAAAGAFISPVINAQAPARDVINEFLEVSNTAAVWSDGVIKFVPYGDVALTANGHTYTPNTTPLYDLTDNDFLPRGGDLDPILVTRKDTATAFNAVTVEYENRDYDYNTQTYEATDQGAIERVGRVPMPTLSLHSIKRAAVAQQVAQLRLQREQNIRNAYQFRLGWKYSLLEPMDLVTLTDAGLGLNLTPVRITAVDELANDEGLEMTAEDWPFGTASATLYGTGPGTGTAPNANVDPGNTTTPVIFEGPSALQSAPLEIWVGASGGATWGGCEVWISTDNTSFEKVGIINGKATFGVTTASLATNAAYPSIDTTHTLSVNTTASGQTLVAQSTTAFTNLAPLCYLGGAEFVAYRDLALTSAFHYDLTHLYRGLYNSVIPASHSSGAAFVFCDTAILKIPWPTGYIGQVLYFKFPAFNIYGAALQDVGSVSSVSHTVGQDPIIPGPSTISPATSQGTVSIDANGNASWQADLPGPWLSTSAGTPLSVKWAFSTSGYPSDATVTASGTVITPSSGIHTVGAASFTTLSLGQTVYVSILAYSGGSALGTILNTIHIQGAYLTMTASKTANYGPGGWQERTNPPWGIYGDGNGNVLGYGVTLTSDILILNMLPIVPSGTAGVTLTSAQVDVYSAGGIGGGTGLDVAFQRKTAGGAVTGIGSGSGAIGGGWQTVTMSISENTSGRGYLFETQLIGATAGGALGVGNARLVYTMTDSKQTL